VTAAQKIFHSLQATKTAAGLHPEQAALVSLRQIVRDARGGKLNMNHVLEIIASEEMRCGASLKAAKLTAKNMSEGRICDFARREIGARRRKRFYPQARPNPRWEAENKARSAELSTWGNGTLGGRT